MDKPNSLQKLFPVVVSGPKSFAVVAFVNELSKSIPLSEKKEVTGTTSICRITFICEKRLSLKQIFIIVHSVEILFNHKNSRHQKN